MEAFARQFAYQVLSTDEPNDGPYVRVLAPNGTDAYLTYDDVSPIHVGDSPEHYEPVPCSCDVSGVRGRCVGWCS